MHGFLLVEVVDYRSVFSRKRLEALFAAGIREAAAIEHEAAAVAGIVLGQALMKRKAEDADDQIVGVRSDALQRFRRQHAAKRAQQSRQLDGKSGVMQKPAKIFQRVGDGLQEMRFAFVEAAETVGAERLQDADVNVSVVVAEKGFAIKRWDVAGERIEIVVEKLLAELGREIGFGIVEERSDVVLQSAFAAALVVDEERLCVVAEEDVARLEVTIEKIISRGAEKKIGQAAEIVFQSALVERNAREPQEIIFEIVEIPGDGLAVEAGDGIAGGVIEIAASFDLKARKDGDDLAISFDGLRRDDFAGAIFREKLIERGVAEVFFEICAVGKVFAVDFRDREAVAAEVAREVEESGVFFAYAVEDADGGGIFIGETDDLAPGTAEFSLQRLDVGGRGAEGWFEERFENVDGHTPSNIADFDERNRDDGR